MKHYIVATQHRSNVQVFRQRISRLPGGWHLVEQPETLVSALTTMAPRAIFFPHWSLKVPNEIVAEHECIAFHATDLPYGRGGTPIQNLIARGIRATLVSAFRMTEDIDEGPVYLKRPLSLEGTAEEIYLRLAGVVADMIEIIVESEPVPRPHSELTVNEACLSGLHPHPLGLEWAQTGYRGARHGCSRPRRSPIPAFATRVPATFPR